MQALVTPNNTKSHREMGGSPEDIAKNIRDLFPQFQPGQSLTVSLPSNTNEDEVSVLVEHLITHYQHPADVVSLQSPNVIRIAVLQ